MSVTALITAGGVGKRFGGSMPKQFQDLCGKPLLVHTLAAFDQSAVIDDLILVLPQNHLDAGQTLVAQADLKKPIQFVAGGDTRQASVFEGLKLVPKDAAKVAIHDAARCLILSESIEELVMACEGWEGAVAAEKVSDTIKEVEGELISGSLDRSKLWAMQTPQVFRFPFILEAHEAAMSKGVEAATDDATLAHDQDGKICVLELDQPNFKVTRPSDMLLASAILQSRT